MIRLMIQEMEETLVELKASCAGLMADQKRIVREQDVPFYKKQMRVILGDNGHLDPRAVAALRAHLQDVQWAPQDDPVSEGSWLWDHHALPTMSEVVAEEVVDADRASR